MIRHAAPGDVPTILALIRGLAEYEHLTHEVAMDETRLREHLFGERRYAEVLIAESERATVGFALFYHDYSTFVSRPGVYLEDLFVLPEHRGKGHGRELLTSLARIAVDRDCLSIEWNVLDWNEPSIAFYRSLGALPMEEWTTYRLAGDALKSLAQ